MNFLKWNHASEKRLVEEDLDKVKFWVSKVEELLINIYFLMIEYWLWYQSVSIYSRTHTYIQVGHMLNHILSMSENLSVYLEQCLIHRQAWCWINEYWLIIETVMQRENQWTKYCWELAFLCMFLYFGVHD